ncbi:hypothetical protein ACFQL1_15870 [Halomicroarcula sp. GCM10025709]|uniref:hypothetical protein n=1 Tax=Haloarcula TaxID=2237 RepID=UPI0024C3803A|nr:hypothetical protein [Halomicroarcula sp. YJ-61-S]
MSTHSETLILGKNAQYTCLEGEVASGATVFPGMLVEETGTTPTTGEDTPTVQPVSTVEDAHSPVLVALTPDTPPHANDADIPRQHEYDAGEHIEYAQVYAGEIQNLLVANGADLATASEANISYDDALATNDDGAVKNATGTDDGILRAREAVDNSGGSGSDGPGDMARIRGLVI